MNAHWLPNRLILAGTVHSGALVSHPPSDFRQELAKHLTVELADLPVTLRNLPAEDLLAVQQAVSFSDGGNIDGTVVTRSSNDAILDRAADGVPLIAGSNRDEAAWAVAVSGTLQMTIHPSL